MKMRMLAIGLGLTALLAGGAARAQGADVKSMETDGGYGYAFEDDPLTAGAGGPAGALITVRPPTAQATLIRPRTSFVPEMLKSVEKI